VYFADVFVTKFYRTESI